jgi:hypothetical protein
MKKDGKTPFRNPAASLSRFLPERLGIEGRLTPFINELLEASCG